MALGVGLIELVLATDVTIEFLQTTPDAWFDVSRLRKDGVANQGNRTAIRGHVKLVFK